VTSTHVPSYYRASTPDFAPEPALEGHAHADVCILGAGFTGLCTAIELAEAGYRVTILEAERIGWGASGRSGGQVIFGYGCDQAKITALLGHHDSRKLFDWSLEGVELLRERCGKYAIDCDRRDG